MFKVPANTPLSVQPLDADGRALQLMQSWMTAMWNAESLVRYALLAADHGLASGAPEQAVSILDRVLAFLEAQGSDADAATAALLHSRGRAMGELGDQKSAEDLVKAFGGDFLLEETEVKDFPATCYRVHIARRKTPYVPYERGAPVRHLAAEFH